MFKRISVETAKELLTNQSCLLVDIRDEGSYESGHIDAATHLTNANLGEFIETEDQNKPVLVYCYHGNSSQGAAQLLASKGFEEVYSVDGGYEEWKTKL